MKLFSQVCSSLQTVCFQPSATMCLSQRCISMKSPRHLKAGDITRTQFDKLVIAINTGTNLPSVATPNGQAAFLFLLTSALAPLIRLSYMRMVFMALPYTIVLTIVGFFGVMYNI